MRAQARATAGAAAPGPQSFDVPLPRFYQARAYQRPFLVAMANGCKRAVLVWHRRAGKDMTAFNYMTVAAFTQRVGTYYYFLPTYKQGKKVIWDGIDGQERSFLSHIPPEIVAKTNETDMQVVLKNGSIVQVVGTDDIDSIRGTNPVGCVFSEYAVGNPGAWKFIEPVLLENGGWAVFVYTPMGKNHGFDLYEAAKKQPGWFVSRLTIDDTRRDDGTPVVTKAQLDDARATGTDDETIQQEYYCSFHGSISGSYYADQLQWLEQQGRITDKVSWDPILPVTCWWDLGMDDAMSIWFVQNAGSERRAIEYLEASGEGFPYYAKLLKSRPYVYARHVMPHDIRVREMGSGRSREQTCLALGISPITVAPKWQVLDGIQATRVILPTFWFNDAACSRGLDALRFYRKEYDEDRKVFKKQPLHDQYSHGADAFRNGVQAERVSPARRTQDYAESDFNPVSYEQDRAEHEQRGPFPEYADAAWSPFDR